MHVNRSLQECMRSDYGGPLPLSSGTRLIRKDQPGSAPEPLKVLCVASEVFPLVKTGGLADVTGALSKSLTRLGVETEILLPAYPVVLEKCRDAEWVGQMNLLGHMADLLKARHEGLDLILLRCPELYERGGGPYLDSSGNDHHDNWLRFAVLSLAGARLATEGLGAWRPDLVHLHDWQAALTACYLKAIDAPIPIVLTIHNLAFQGQFSAGTFWNLELPDRFSHMDVMEYYHDISYLKAGIQLADAVTTVSPTYAREILSDRSGMGMAGVLRSRRSVLSGILNGIDSSVWDPETDPSIPFNYSAGNIGPREMNRAAIERQFGLKQGPGPIVCVISRLTWQKGIDMLADMLPVFNEHGAKLIVLGDGGMDVVYPLLEQVRHHSGQIAVQIGYSEEAAHLLIAGSDILLQPSRFEPCGLTQLYALRYGAVPIVARTGGLAETVIDANEAAIASSAATGFHFHPGSKGDLHNALERAFNTHRQTAAWRQLQMRGMHTDFGWERSAAQYADLYRSLIGEKITSAVTEQ